MTGPHLESAGTRLIRIPLTRPWGADVVDLRVIAVDVRDSEGDEGYGFSWTPTIGGRAVHAMLEEDLLPFALGRAADPTTWEDNWLHLHEAGGGGVSTIALAGLDLALWDLHARRAESGVAEFIGRKHERLRTYGSGVNIHYSISELVDQVTRWVEAGHQAVKIKVGKTELGEDLERVSAVREVLGPDRELMVDANQRWDLARATAAAEAFGEYGITWLEEPLRADDLAGHVELHRRSPIPIALGENLHNWYRFRDFIDAGAVDVVQPNVVRVGGITPFLRIAKLAADHGIQVAPHLLPELSAQVAFTLPEPVWVEDVEDAGFEQLGALTEATGITIGDGWVSGGPSLGLGMRFRDEQRAS